METRCRHIVTEKLLNHMFGLWLDGLGGKKRSHYRWYTTPLTGEREVAENV